MKQFPIIDSHTHIYSYQDEELSEVLSRSCDNEVKSVIDSSVDLNSATRINLLSKKHKNIFGGIGLHPQNLTREINAKDISKIYELVTNNKKLIVISEIGLDFQESSPDRMIQYSAFRKQIGIARELNKPIIFHSRHAIKEVLKILKEERAFEIGGAMHYFQSNLEIAKEIIDIGFHISFGKPLLRKPDLEEVLKVIPLNKIIVETDSAPQPFKKNREKWTEPKDCKLIIDKISEIKQIETNKIQKEIFYNTFNMLKNGSKWLEINDFN